MPYGPQPLRRMVYRRPYGGYRRKRRYEWVRFSFNNVGPVQGPSTNNDDVLAPFRTTASIGLNFPEFTIWRIHIKVSIVFSWSPAVITANSGAQFALMVDSINQAPMNVITNPYEESFMMWDFLYATEQLFLGAGAATTLGDSVIYKEYDIRSKRRVRNLGDTLWAQLVSQGNCSLTQYSYTSSVLIGSI